MSKKKIVLVTSSQPSLNPRMVKEADILAENGYDVVVVGQFWNDWATKTDQPLLNRKKWKFILVGGNPLRAKYSYFFSRVIHKISRAIREKAGNKYLIAELAIGRCSFQLYKEAVKQKGDLYIGHNPGGLAPAIMAAKRNNAKCGFDAEDFHRLEYSDDRNHPDVKCKTYLEEKYFPKADYLTVASPLIGQEYSVLFPQLIFNPILNVFPRTSRNIYKNSYPTQPLKLFWFSQTVGPNRGLDVVLKAIKIVGSAEIQLHVLGYPRAQAIQNYRKLAEDYHFKPKQLNFYKPIPPYEIFEFASQFDIGLATEIGVPYNRNICLTNKIFTYIQSGLAVVASNTSAQQQLLLEHPNCGFIFDMASPKTLADILKHLLHDRDALNWAKRNSFDYGQQVLNWECESEKFLSLIENTLAL